MLRNVRLTLVLLSFSAAALSVNDFARPQQPVFGNGKIDIDQDALVKNCKTATDPHCFYRLIDVLRSGGDFWTTPFTPYDPATKTGDGYGEGVDGPRSAQRHAFNPRDSTYRFLRLNGLDSQSCFECHNSTGSATVDSRGALIRRPYGVAGSAGSNSNAFINPKYPKEQTLFIRQPPAVFGSGYQQSVGDEMTMRLWLERDKAREIAKMRLSAGNKPNAVTVPLVANGIPFGTFTTTYIPGSSSKILAGPECAAAGLNPVHIGGAPEFTDDVRGVDGVSCDLVIRPLQWKGVASSLRHFVRDALDFHQSMQAFEKVSLCDCDGDGKGTPTTGPEVTMGNVTAITAFVAMTRPPVQLARTTPQEQLGEKIFHGDKSVPGLYKSMCANCHVGPMRLVVPVATVEWPTNSLFSIGGNIDPLDETTWPIPQISCRSGKPTSKSGCPVEAVFPKTGAAAKAAYAKNPGSLVTPAVSSDALALVYRYKANFARVESKPEFRASLLAGPSTVSVSDAEIKALRAPLTAAAAGLDAKALSSSSDPLTGTAYVLPLSAPPEALSPLQLPRLPAEPDGSVMVPLMSDLKRHNMGRDLTDTDSQGTDVENIVNVPDQFLTRPLWGVADTGPWLHDGRALTLKDAILMHGNSATGSEAGPVVDAFAELTPDQQDAVVDFLLTLRLPPPGGFAAEPPLLPEAVPGKAGK